MTRLPPQVLADGFVCAESPRWHDGELYFSDMYDRRVVAVDLDGRVRTVATVADVPTGLGWLPDGRLLIATQRGRRLLRLEPDGTLVTHADLTDTASSSLNDMWVDSKGNAYVGEIGFDAETLLADLMATHPTRESAVAALIERVRDHPGRIHLVKADGSHRVVASGILLPNGMTLDRDERQLSVVASLEPAIIRFDVSPDGGLFTRTTLMRTSFPPDGMSTIDSEGAVWVADPEGHGAVRITSQGTMSARIGVQTKCLAVALGGPDGRTLFLCTTESNDETTAIRLRSSRIETVEIRQS